MVEILLIVATALLIAQMLIDLGARPKEKRKRKPDISNAERHRIDAGFLYDADFLYGQGFRPPSVIEDDAGRDPLALLNELSRIAHDLERLAPSPFNTPQDVIGPLLQAITLLAQPSYSHVANRIRRAIDRFEWWD